MRQLGLLLGTFALALGLILAPAESDPARPEPGLALAGPARDLARDFAWISFQRARLAGDDERALRAAARAVALDPELTDGWLLLASHFGFFHASPEREPDVERRRLLLDAALSTLDRGRERARHPEELDFQSGLLLLTRAEFDPEIALGGARELYDRAGTAFDAASAAGHPEGALFASYARELASASTEE